jgi:hypothetical protein
VTNGDLTYEEKSALITMLTGTGGEALAKVSAYMAQYWRDRVMQISLSGQVASKQEELIRAAAAAELWETLPIALRSELQLKEPADA